MSIIVKRIHKIAKYISDGIYLALVVGLVAFLVLSTGLGILIALASALGVLLAPVVLILRAIL